MTTTAFTDARTAYCGFMVSSYDVPAGGMAYGNVDNSLAYDSARAGIHDYVDGGNDRPLGLCLAEAALN